MSKIWKTIKTIFYVAIIAASVFIIITSLNIFGFQMFIVKSGSMEPKIHTGSVVIDHTATNYKLKNVITFKIANSRDTVTHRIVQINTKDGVTSYRVKGDANSTPDPGPVLKSNVVGKVLFSIPELGYLIAFIRTLPGLIIFIAIPGIIIISDEIANIKDEVRKIRSKGKDKDTDEKLAELEARETKIGAKELSLQNKLKKNIKRTTSRATNKTSRSGNGLIIG
jgi:signal peptidase